MKEFLEDHNAKTLEVYRIQPHLIREHHGTEETVLAGGYGYRQIAELVQNGADAILEAEEDKLTLDFENRVEVVLREKYLYVANTGAPISQDGLIALLSANTSPKRGNEIGRFGLGFKSLLKLEGQIDVFSKTKGAFRFDPEYSRDIVRNEFEVEHAPGLRMAFPVDHDGSDPVLSEMNWAETIVRVEVPKPSLVVHLRKEIQKFPEEFLIFLRHSMVLILDDGVSEAKRVSVEKAGTLSTLHVGGASTRWQVISKEVKITDEAAKEDARSLHNRDSVPLTWAYPLDAKRLETGLFWAFFPTTTASYLPGILNAPWKLNSDRDSIIRGALNEFLMQEAASMVVEHLPKIATEEDPGAVLDYFPRRLNSKDAIAAPFVQELKSLILAAELLPAANGQLKRPEWLWRHPVTTMEDAELWRVLASAEARSHLVHPSCMRTPQRNGRLKALSDELGVGGISMTNFVPNLMMQPPATWIEAVASTEVDGACDVLVFVERYQKGISQSDWGTLRSSLKVVPTTTGELVAADEAIFQPNEGAHKLPGRHYVQHELAENTEARRILKQVFGIGEVDDQAWESLLLTTLNEGNSKWGYRNEAAMGEFWERLRSAPSAVQDSFIQRYRGSIQVRRGNSAWVTADEVLLPGGLVGDNPLETLENENALVQPRFHGNDVSLLQKIGVQSDLVGEPTIEKTPKELNDWLEYCRSDYVSSISRNPRRYCLEPNRFKMPFGWKVLPLLKGGANARLTERFLQSYFAGDFGQWVGFGHDSVESYPRRKVRHPLSSFLVEWGQLDLGGVIISLRELIAHRDQAALDFFPGWSQWKEYIQSAVEADELENCESDDVTGFWRELLHGFLRVEKINSPQLRVLWDGATSEGVVFSRLPWGDDNGIPLSEIYVSSSAEVVDRYSTEERLVICLSEANAATWIKRGARRLDDLIQPEWIEIDELTISLLSVFPEFDDVLTEDAKACAACRMVQSLCFNMEEAREQVPCLLREDVLLIDSEQLKALGRAERNRRVVIAVAEAGWLKHSADVAIDRVGNSQLEALRANVAEQPTLETRLLCAVGRRAEPLLEALGGLSEKPFIRDCSELQLAELVLAQHGPCVLNVLKTALEVEGLNPPGRWNTAAARAFVTSLGFPLSFAQSPAGRRDSELTITGPDPLPPLHDFQQEVLDGVEALSTLPEMKRRAVISLPTGGGKTRVTVEAAVLHFLKPEGARRSVIWIAQSDELCEQAVQAFQQVWLNRGAARTDLRIVRLWGGNQNPDLQETDKPVVVVASIQTLHSRMGSAPLEWLREPSLVVVDECHHAITRSYTGMLKWLNAEVSRTGVIEKEQPVILGLSATPFRSDDDESKRLAKRFDSRWLPNDQSGLQTRLRRQGVLSEIENYPLDSGVGLLPDEESKLAELWEHRDGLDFDRLIEAINQRLAGSEKRNHRIVEYLSRLKGRSTLFFANSVAHAEEVSARLNLAGIRSAAVSGGTSRSTRRYFLDAFQRGEIRVLCNHSVLTTGFDAPKTDVVVISRNVFSAVRYMQMVGRGLRGEANGGTAHCKIVTVMDNLGRFQGRHPYHYCQEYFTTG